MLSVWNVPQARGSSICGMQWHTMPSSPPWEQQTPVGTTGTLVGCSDWVTFPGEECFQHTVATQLINGINHFYIYLYASTRSKFYDCVKRLWLYQRVLKSKLLQCESKRMVIIVYSGIHIILYFFQIGFFYFDRFLMHV